MACGMGLKKKTKKVKKLLDRIPALIILYTYRVSHPKGKYRAHLKKEIP